MLVKYTTSRLFVLLGCFEHKHWEGIKNCNNFSWCLRVKEYTSLICPNLILPNLTKLINWVMLIIPNLAGASQANGAMLRLLRTSFRVFYLGLKWNKGVVNGVRGLTGPSGYLLDSTSKETNLKVWSGKLSNRSAKKSDFSPPASAIIDIKLSATFWRIL